MNKHFHHGNKDRLRAPERLEALPRHQIIALSVDRAGIHSVLDIGVGSAVFAEAFAAAGMRVGGLDDSAVMLAEARTHAPGLWCCRGSAEFLPFAAKSWDLAFLGFLLHEVDNPVAVMAEARRAIRKRVAVLEWAYEQTGFGPPIDHRMSPREIERAGTHAKLTLAGVHRFKHMALYLFDRR